MLLNFNSWAFLPKRQAGFSFQTFSFAKRRIKKVLFTLSEVEGQPLTQIDF
jgi:hypothetical protein